jgi:hypothetical protein
LLLTADKLELPERNDPKVCVLWLVRNWQCNEANGRSMMIVDNADDIEVFYPTRACKRDESLSTASAPQAAYLPQRGNGSILITSGSEDVAARLAGGYKNIKVFIIWDDVATLFRPSSTSLLICACRLVQSFSSGRHVSAGSRSISILFGENFRRNLYVGSDKAGGIVDLLEAVISGIPQSLGSGKDWGLLCGFRRGLRGSSGGTSICLASCDRR